ncbi:transcriptional activator RfaH [Thalassovita mediterranea]|nr:transcriptional activator RfaH [Thalassovita mediterranea]
MSVNASHTWFAAQTLAGKENLAVSHLNRQGFETTCPQLWRTVRHARQTRRVLRPIFPGYVFVNVDMQRMRWRAIDSTVGVSRIVRFGDRPAALPTDLVENFKAQTGEDGAIEFEDTLGVGDEIRVMSGAFQDWIGRIVDLPDNDRVKVLLGMMTRHVEVTLPRKQLAKAS